MRQGVKVEIWVCLQLVSWAIGLTSLAMRVRMSTSRKKRSPAPKAKVAIAAIKAQKTTSQLATEFGIHPSQIAKWKKQAIDSISEIFEQSSRSTDEATQREMASLDAPRHRKPSKTRKPVESARPRRRVYRRWLRDHPDR